MSNVKSGSFHSLTEPRWKYLIGVCRCVTVQMSCSGDGLPPVSEYLSSAHRLNGPTSPFFGDSCFVQLESPRQPRFLPATLKLYTTESFPLSQTTKQTSVLSQFHVRYSSPSFCMRIFSRLCHFSPGIIRTSRKLAVPPPPHSESLIVPHRPYLFLCASSGRMHSFTSTDVLHRISFALSKPLVSYSVKKEF